MKEGSRSPLIKNASDNLLTIQLSDHISLDSVQAGLKGHRRTHTQRLFIHQVDFPNPRLKQVPSSPFKTSSLPYDITDLRSFPSTTIESGASESDCTILSINTERTTVKRDSPCSPAANFASELKLSMEAMLREASREAADKQAARRAVKDYLINRFMETSHTTRYSNDLWSVRPKQQL